MSGIRTLIDPAEPFDTTVVRTSTPPFVFHEGVKVWPVKGRIRYDLTLDKVNRTLVTHKATSGGTLIHGVMYNIWAAQPELLTRPFIGETWIALPNNPKFSRFHELNLRNNHMYRIVLFSKPMKDTTDKGEISTIGFVADLMMR